MVFYRQLVIGEVLVVAVIDKAKLWGFYRLRLDKISKMIAVKRIIQSFRFSMHFTLVFQSILSAFYLELRSLSPAYMVDSRSP